MSKAEKFIEDYTKTCSNELSDVCFEAWLTPDDARRAVEIAREEVIEAAVKWLEGNAVSYLDKCDNPTYMGGYFIKTKELAEDFRKYMEDNV